MNIFTKLKNIMPKKTKPAAPAPEKPFTPGPDPFSDNAPDMRYADTMTATKPVAPADEEVITVGKKARAVIETMGPLTPEQRRQVIFGAQKIYCFGCGNTLRKGGKPCKVCN